MTPSAETNQKLERLVHETLRGLPARRAPASLEQRVLAEMARRGALPWWRKSFAHWPVPARAGFSVVLAGVAKLVLLAAVWIMAGFDGVQFREAFATPVNWIESALVVAGAMRDFFAIVGRSIPTLWWYAGGAVIMGLYSLLFGLGAAAYRTLYARR